MNNLLEHIDYEITKSCNLKCIHCSAEAGKGDGPNLYSIKRVLSEGKNLGLKRIGITGGEPFLFPKELSDLIDFSFDELNCAVHIHSNGQLIEKNLNLVYERAGKIENLTLTLMGYESSHNQNTGKDGSYKKLKSAAQNLVKMPVPIMMFFIPMSNNYKDFSKAVKDFYQIGVRRFRIMRLSPGGRAKQTYDSLKLNDEQSKSFIENLKILEEELDFDFEAGFCTRLLYPDLKPLRYHPACMSGINRLHINNQGYVFPCTSSSGFIELNIGNVNSQLLAEIWKESRVLKELRKKYPSRNCNVQDFYTRCSHV